MGDKITQLGNEQIKCPELGIALCALQVCTIAASILIIEQHRDATFFRTIGLEVASIDSVCLGRHGGISEVEIQPSKGYPTGNK